jgi:hypothetical protein
MYLQPIAKKVSAIFEEWQLLRIARNSNELLLDYITRVFIGRGESQSIVRECHFRNIGSNAPIDDALAMPFWNPST